MKKQQLLFEWQQRHGKQKSDCLHKKERKKGKKGERGKKYGLPKGSSPEQRTCSAKVRHCRFTK